MGKEGWNMPLEVVRITCPKARASEDFSVKITQHMGFLVLLTAVCFSTVGFGIVSTANVLLTPATSFVVDLRENIALCVPKYILASIACVTFGELSLCCGLIFLMLRLERVIGSARFLLCIAFLFVARIPIQFGMQALLDYGLRASGGRGGPDAVGPFFIAPSPVWLMLSLHLTQRCLLPDIDQFVLFSSLPLGKFAMCDILCAQLVLARGTQLVPDFIVGALCGLILCSSFVRLHTFSVPKRVEHLVKSTAHPRLTLYLSPLPMAPAPAPRRTAASSGAASRSRVGEEEALTMLLDMGFDRERATAALRRSQTDVNLAVNDLLGIGQ